jgi:hypothetical protein
MTDGPRNAAVRAEPVAVGTAAARDPLAREVKLLGALLGQVIVEQEGRSLGQNHKCIDRQGGGCVFLHDLDCVRAL